MWQKELSDFVYLPKNLKVVEKNVKLLKNFLKYDTMN